MIASRKQFCHFNDWTHINIITLGLVSIVCSSLITPLIAFPFISSNKPEKVPSKVNDDDRQSRFQIEIGPCKWVFNRKCPDSDIKFFLYTKQNPSDRQSIHIDETWEKSNISDSNFNANHPVKIIIHGYNTDMFLTPLIQMKEEYFDRGNYNLFFVDWSVLAPAPCYPSAAQNTRHAGECIGQLIQRLKDAGTENIHIIGFSLGAHVAGFAANHVKEFQIPRITGLDPALPLFITGTANDKLDPSDAAFVDVIHSNALVQGKVERCGHVDFYMNGGIVQPGCFQFGINPFACSHHRAPDYFTESIKSERGFWGWPCNSYINYLLGLCPRSNELRLAGEDCRTNTKGMFLVTTNDASPYATGQWIIQPEAKTTSSMVRRDPFLEKIDVWGKLDGSFNGDNGNRYKLFGARRPSDRPHSNHIENNEYFMIDKPRLEMNDKAKQSSSTEPWRQNDKFFLTENPFTLFNYTPTQQQQQQLGSSDEFQFPKVTYR